MCFCGNWWFIKQVGLCYYNGFNKYELYVSFYKKVCYLWVYCECVNFLMVEVKFWWQSFIKFNYEVIYSLYLIIFYDVQFYVEFFVEKF